MSAKPAERVFSNYRHMIQHQQLSQHALRSHILEFAFQKFLAMGIKSVKMDDIAAQAGISKRTLYEMFGDKENLLLECLQQESKTREAEYRRMANRAKSPIELYVNVMEANARNAKYTSTRFIAEAAKYDSLQDYFRSAAEEKQKSAIDFYQKGIDDGYFRSDVDFKLVTALSDLLVRSVIEKRFYEQYPLQDIANTISPIWLRGFCTQKGIDEYERSMKHVSTH